MLFGSTVIWIQSVCLEEETKMFSWEPSMLSTGVPLKQMSINNILEHLTLLTPLPLDHQNIQKFWCLHFVKCLLCDNKSFDFGPLRFLFQPLCHGKYHSTVKDLISQHYQHKTMPYCIIKSFVGFMPLHREEFLRFNYFFIEIL